MRSFILDIVKIILIISCIPAVAQPTGSQIGLDEIRLNQVGFYPDGPKLAVVPATFPDTFLIVTSPGGKEVFSGKLTGAKEWPHSKEVVRRANFSEFKEPGTYVMQFPGVGNSHAFKIEENVHFEAARAAMKAFYFQRASTALPVKYAGRWARDAGHPDDEVKVHNSAATANRPAGSIISSPGGWYDAGDYGKYIVNSGITMGTLFSLYEDFPHYLDTLDLNIPESQSHVPDFLEETLYNLRWIMSMQDEDGGVYHKLTSADFHGSVLPKDAVFQRWVMQKSTAATLNFAAVTAQGARIYDSYKNELPGLKDSLLVMSKKAYNWAKENPKMVYDQRKLKDPPINTGAYGDINFEDEFRWAAIELFITTGDTAYYKEAGIENALNDSLNIPSWANVDMLALYTLARNREKFTGNSAVAIQLVLDKVIAMGEELVDYSQNSAYATPMGVKETNFKWGSNSEAANQGILLLSAYMITHERKYLDAAIANLDYLLGRNATGFSFLTGYGEKSTRDPHHRPSEADDNPEPVPGLLAGGPNPGQQDKISCGDKYTPAHQYPATSYIDDKCSYASNEVAINWNAPLVYLAFAIEALK